MADKPITNMQKVVVLLKSLPKETLDKVLKFMDPRQGQMLVKEVSKAPHDPQQSAKLAHILEEAAQMLGSASPNRTAERPPQPRHAPPPPAAGKPAKAPDTRLDVKVDDDLPDKMRIAAAQAAATQAVTTAPGPVGDPLSALAEVPAEQLAAALESENARTAFILMEKLPVDLAARIYRFLTSAKRKEISLRFAEKTAVNDHIIKQIAQGVLKKCQKLRTLTTAAAPDDERQHFMATLIKGLDRTERMEMLTLLEKTDPALTERVKNRLYDFEVIARMESSSVQKLLAEMNMQELALALRGAPAEVEKKLLDNLSKRAQDILKEEVSLIGNVTPARVLEARQAIVLSIQQLDQRGDFVLTEE